MTVSSEAIEPFFSKPRKLSIRGSSIDGVVSGYSCVILLTDLISK